MCPDHAPYCAWFSEPGACDCGLMKRGDILDRLADLHMQATEQRSHFYIGKVVKDAMKEIVQLRVLLAQYQDDAE